MDYNYTIYFTYDGKCHKCSFESEHAYSQDSGDEGLLANFIAYLIEKIGCYRKGKLVTNAVLKKDESPDCVCVISNFEMRPNKK